MTRVKQIANKLIKFILLVGLIFLYLNCTQEKEKIDLESEKTIVFHLKKNDSTFYDKEDNKYFITPFTFKRDLTKQKHTMSYQDVRSKLMSVDSFWSKWLEDIKLNNTVDYQLYLFIKEHDDKDEGKLIPLDDDWLLTIELDSVDY